MNVNEVVGIIFAVLLVATIVAAPWLAAEDRPAFLQPNVKPTNDWDGGPMKNV